MSEVDIALKYAVDFDSDKFEYNELDALRVLAAEVRRLRAAVEAVQLMPRYDISTTQVGSSMEPDSFGDWVKYDDVLAALEATDENG